MFTKPISCHCGFFRICTECGFHAEQHCFDVPSKKCLYGAGGGLTLPVRHAWNVIDGRPKQDS